MPGSLFDLSDLAVELPARVAVDTNVLATRFFSPSAITPALALRRQRIAGLIRQMRRVRSAGVLMPTVYVEFIHLAIRSRYRRDLGVYASEIGGKKSWELLFKTRPDLLRAYEPYLRRFPDIFESMGMLVLQPEAFASSSSTRYETALINVVLRHALDTSDASILLEMERAGITALVTEDADMTRAASEFDIYAWL